MFRIALTIYARRSSQLTVAVRPTDTILSSFRLRTNIIGNSQIFSQAQKCREQNQAPRGTHPKNFRSGTSRPYISDPLRSCSSVEEVLDHPKVDNCWSKHVLDTIHKLHKAGKTELSAKEICRTKKFRMLTADVRSDLRSLSADEAVNVLKILTEFGISSDSTVCQSLLKLISVKANGLTLKAIIFLDFLLRKCTRSPIVDKLQSTLPVVFETEVRSQWNTDDITTLATVVRIAFRNRSVSVATRVLVADAALDEINQFSEKEIENMFFDFTLAENDPKNIHDLHSALMTRHCGPNDEGSDVDDAVTILKKLIRSGISSNSTKCQRLLSSISVRAHDLRLSTIIFVGFLLRKCAPSPIVDELQSTIWAVFEIRVRSQLDTCDTATLANVVRFAFTCRSVSAETRRLVVDAALDEVNQFSAKEIADMLRDFTVAENDPKNIQDLLSALVTRLYENPDQFDPNDVGSDLGDAVCILKKLIRSGISSNSTECQSILRFISARANDLPLNTIIFLDFLLNKCASSPTVDKLQSTLPVVFETRVRSQLAADDVATLVSAVRFAFKCRSVSVATRGLLVDAALDKVNQFSVKEIGALLHDSTVAKDDPKNIHDLRAALKTESKSRRKKK